MTFTSHNRNWTLITKPDDSLFDEGATFELHTAVVFVPSPLSSCASQRPNALTCLFFLLQDGMEFIPIEVSRFHSGYVLDDEGSDVHLHMRDDGHIDGVVRSSTGKIHIVCSI